MKIHSGLNFRENYLQNYQEEAVD